MRIDERDYVEKNRKRRSRGGFSFDDIKDFVIDYYQYFGVGILFICLVIILSIFSSSVKDEVEKNKTSATTEKTEGAIDVPDAELEVDAHEDVNALVAKYFEATATGDTATLSQICSNLDEEEAIRIEEKAKFTENYSNFTIYTKPGPEEASYIVFGYYEIKFKNIDTLAPGLTSLFIKTRGDGELYIYDDELTDEESEYVKAIASQKDVVDLLNTVDQKYADAAASDETLKNFMDVLPTALDDAVATELAARQSAASSDSEEEAQAEGEPLKDFKVKSMDNVNVRSGPSKDSDKLGQLLAGDTFTCLEAMADGWSRIDFQGSEAYVKTEFIERLNDDGTTSPIDTSSLVPESTEGEAVAETTEEAPAAAPSGKVKVNENVRVRAGAGTDKDILGQAQGGETYDYLGEENGWTKISYKGSTGYIRNDFVTKQ